MNKYHGSKFDDFLKEEGIYEEVKALAQKRWKELKTEDMSDTPEIIEESSGRITRFFQWFRHAIYHFVS